MWIRVMRRLAVLTGVIGLAAGSLIVTDSGPDEIAVASVDFDQTDHRVEFLSLLRRRNDRVCRNGFRTIRLTGSWSSRFSETYPLDCSASPSRWPWALVGAIPGVRGTAET
jgi:hypothetical protein